MTPTRQEIKAAIEWCLYVCKEIDDSNSGAAAKLSSADVTAVLRAMLETFDEREDFLEAANAVAEAYVRVANTDEYGPKLMAMVTLYRRKIGQRDVPGEVRIAGRRLVEKEGKCPR